MIFFLIFVALDVALFLLVGTYWKLAKGETAIALKLQYAAGVFTFIFCMFGWYLLISILLVTLDFPFGLPVVDLSTRIPSASDRKKSPGAAA